MIMMSGPSWWWEMSFALPKQCVKAKVHVSARRFSFFILSQICLALQVLSLQTNTETLADVCEETMFTSNGSPAALFSLMLLWFPCKESGMWVHDGTGDAEANLCCFFVFDSCVMINLPSLGVLMDLGVSLELSDVVCDCCGEQRAVAHVALVSGKFKGVLLLGLVKEQTYPRLLRISQLLA